MSRRDPPGSTRRSGNRSNSSLRPTSPSMRASAAPRQKCRPAEKDDVLLRVRACHVEAGRLAEHGRVAVRRREHRGHQRALVDRGAADRGVAPGRAPGEQHRRVEAQDLVHRVRPQLRTGAQQLELIAVRVEQGHPVAEQVHGRLEAGREDQAGGRLELALVEADALLLRGDQLAEQIVAWVVAQLAQVGAEPLVERGQRRLHRTELSPGQPEVQTRRCRGAEAENPLVARSPAHRGSRR